MKTAREIRNEERIARDHASRKTLYNVSYILPNGLRTIMGPAQGRHMKATREEAEETLAAILANNSPDRLLSIFGPRFIETARVDAFECYGHGDPVGIYVDEETSS